jgi:hypothetical protein
VYLSIFLRPVCLTFGEAGDGFSKETQQQLLEKLSPALLLLLLLLRGFEDPSRASPKVKQTGRRKVDRYITLKGPNKQDGGRHYITIICKYIYE